VVTSSKMSVELSVRLSSVRNVNVLWLFSLRYIKSNFTVY